MAQSLEIPEIETITETLQKIRNRERSAGSVVTDHIDRAIKIYSQLNAFISISDREAVIAKAEAIDKQIADGKDPGKLAGIPFTVKDLYQVKGTKTTFGTKLMEDYIAPFTATVVKRLEDEGAILIGKTNCDPFGMGGSGENSGYGDSKNPYDLERTPGGSSSGSAASLAAGVGLFSLGTDTGGSVRQPASFTGLFGYKPTYGRNSRYGISAMGSSFDTPAFFTRHVEDTILLEEIMQGRDQFDATTYDLEHVEQNNFDANQTYTVGVPKEFFSDGLDAEVKEVVMKKISALESAGHIIKEISIPTMEFALAIYYILVPAEISSNRAKFDGVRYGKFENKEYMENVYKVRSKYFEDEVKRRIMIGTYVLSAGYGDKFYQKASVIREKLKAEFTKTFEEVDFVVGPVSPTTAFKLGENSDDPLKMYLQDIYTVNANLTGIPAISVPIGKDSDGLPIGIHVMASKFDDMRMLGFAATI